MVLKTKKWIPHSSGSQRSAVILTEPHSSCRQDHVPSMGFRGKCVPCLFPFLTAIHIPWHRVASLQSLPLEHMASSFFMYPQISLCLPLKRIRVFEHRVHADNQGQSPHLNSFNLITAAKILPNNILGFQKFGPAIFRGRFSAYCTLHPCSHQQLRVWIQNLPDPVQNFTHVLPRINNSQNDWRWNQFFFSKEKSTQPTRLRPCL